MGCGSSSVVQPIPQSSSSRLYNLLQEKTECLIVDARMSDVYRKSRVRGSFNLPPSMHLVQSDKGLDSSMSLQSITDTLLELDDGVTFLRQLGRPAVVVHCGSNPDWSETLLRFLKRESKHPVLDCPDFDSFFERFPFMCDGPLAESRTVEARKAYRAARPGSQRPPSSAKAPQSYPAEVVENFLYYGTLAEASSWTVLSSLGITHIVACTKLRKATLPKGHGLVSLTLEVHPNAALLVLRVTSERFQLFLQSLAKTPGAKALVLADVKSDGISSGLLCWHLIKSHRLNYASALARLQTCRPCVVPTPNFRLVLNDLSDTLMADPTEHSPLEFDWSSPQFHPPTHSMPLTVSDESTSAGGSPQTTPKIRQDFEQAPLPLPPPGSNGESPPRATSPRAVPPPRILPSMQSKTSGAWPGGFEGTEDPLSP